jgi:hypothetical protein
MLTVVFADVCSLLAVVGDGQNACHTAGGRDQGYYVALSARCEGEGSFRNTSVLRSIVCTCRRVSYLTVCVHVLLWRA